MSDPLLGVTGVAWFGGCGPSTEGRRPARPWIPRLIGRTEQARHDVRTISGLIRPTKAPSPSKGGHHGPAPTLHARLGLAHVSDRPAVSRGFRLEKVIAGIVGTNRATPDTRAEAQAVTEPASAG